MTTTGDSAPDHPRSADARRLRRLAHERTLRRRRRFTSVLAATLVLVAAGAAWAFAGPSSDPPTAIREVDAGPTADLVEPVVTAMREYAVEAAKRAAPPKPAKTAQAAAGQPLIPAPGVKTIVVDKSDQVVTLYRADGAVVDSFPCASGNLYPRVGTYKVSSRKAASMSTRDDSRFYHFVIFTKSDTGTNIGFHSIPIDRDEQEIGGLGKPISHGCVRLAHEKAEFVYDWAKNGTKVVVQK